MLYAKISGHRSAQVSENSRLNNVYMINCSKSGEEKIDGLTCSQWHGKNGKNNKEHDRT